MKIRALFVAVLGLSLAAPVVLAQHDQYHLEDQHNPATQTVVNVSVDYTRTLGQLIADGKYDWVDPDIFGNFSIEPGSDVISTDIILLNFNRGVTGDQVLSEMARLGLRPATLCELLSLGAQWPTLQVGFPIVALGSVVQVDGDRRVACLGGLDRERDLGLGWFDREWGVIFQFAAVRK